MNALLPVYDRWVGAGGNGVLIGNGKAAELLPKQGRPFRWYPTAEAVLAEIPNPAALVTTFCGGESLGRDLVPLLNGKCPRIAQLDFWSAPFRPGQPWAPSEYHPDYVLVDSEYGAACARVGYTGRITEFGFPALDPVVAMDRDAVARVTRERFGIPEEDAFVVLFAGQDDGSSEILELLASTMCLLREFHTDRQFVLIPRAHPRMRSDWPLEAERWDAAIRGLSGVSIVDGSLESGAMALIAASDVVVSWCSTMLITAAAFRRVPIAWQSEADRKRYCEVAGNAVEEFPLVTMGCGWSAADADALRAQLDGVLVGDTGALVAAQERELRLDGKNAERIAEFIRTRIREFCSSGD